MDWIPAVTAASLAAVLGWFGAGYQHLLYRTPEQRERRAGGRKLLGLRSFLAVAAAAAAALAFRPGHYDAGPALATAVFAIILCVFTSTDFDQRLIPNRLSYPAMALAVLFCWVWPDRPILAIALGGIFAVGLAAVLLWSGRLVGGGLGLGAALGDGDGDLIILISLVVGWPAAMYAVLYGIVFGGIAAVVLMAMKGRKYRYAYGPYLALGGLIVILWPGRFV